jgi:transposase
MMGRQTGDESQLFYLFNLEERIPARHLLRRINPIVTRVLADLREKLKPFYSEIGRPSIDPALMLRMLIVGYCYGIRFERKLCEDVELHLAYRWFCRLDLDDRVPDHSTFSVNRHGRFRDSDLFRQLFEAVVRACMDAGLVKGEGFAVDASVMEADASRYHGRAPGEIDWSAPERQTRAVAEFLSGLDDEDPTADRKPPKVISPTDPCSAWTAKANKRVQFGYGLNYLIDIENAVIPDQVRDRCRGDAGPDVRRGGGHQDNARAHRATARSEARSAGRRYGVRNGQVPWLARRHRHHAAYPGVGQGQA